MHWGAATVLRYTMQMSVLTRIGMEFWNTGIESVISQFYWSNIMTSGLRGKSCAVRKISFVSNNKGFNCG